MSEVITCPSGLSGRIRGMKVREERILTDRKLARTGGQVDHLLTACWEETLDPGPYDFGDKEIDWSKAPDFRPQRAFKCGCESGAVGTNKNVSGH